MTPERKADLEMAAEAIRSAIREGVEPNHLPGLSRELRQLMAELTAGDEEEGVVDELTRRRAASRSNQASA